MQRLVRLWGSDTTAGEVAGLQVHGDVVADVQWLGQQWCRALTQTRPLSPAVVVRR
jgi:hypothetical protein